jgi:hypothetical protein
MKTFIGAFFLSFILNILSFSQTVSNPQSFKLQGKINGENSGHIVLKYWSNKKYIKDTTELKDGEFVFKGSIIEPTAAELVAGNGLNTASIYMEPGDMKVTLTKDRFKDLQMTGSKIQEEMNELNLLKDPIQKRRDILWTKYSSIRDSLTQKSNDNMLSQKLEETYEYRQMSQLDEQLSATELRFVQSHPKSFLSGVLLLTFNKNETISLDSLKSIYNNLDITIQNSENGRGIKKDITKKENSSVGAIAPDFKAIDLNKQPIT